MPRPLRIPPQARSALIALALATRAVPALAADPTQRIVHAPGPSGALEGTLLTPAGIKAATLVIIIPGSGNIDRDGNNAMLKASTYRLLAEGLAAHGIATLRIDKRGLYGSKPATPDPNAVTAQDYASDIHAWLTTAHTLRPAPCAWLLGHSEGGLIALLAAAYRADVCGLILVATPGRKFGDVLRQQLAANPANAPILDQALHAIDALEHGQHVDPATLHPALMPLFRPAVQNLLISEFALDPTKLIAAETKPVLILQGDRDIQVDKTDADRLHRADPKAALIHLPNANHILKDVPSDSRADNIATYRDPTLPLDRGAVPAIAAFVLRGGEGSK
jgi:pimeloyl-ACP methyl ester carboxylesterase